MERILIGRNISRSRIQISRRYFENDSSQFSTTDELQSGSVRQQIIGTTPNAEYIEVYFKNGTVKNEKNGKNGTVLSDFHNSSTSTAVHHVNSSTIVSKQIRADCLDTGKMISARAFSNPSHYSKYNSKYNDRFLRPHFKNGMAGGRISWGLPPCWRCAAFGGGDARDLMKSFPRNLKFPKS